MWLVGIGYWYWELGNWVLGNQVVGIRQLGIRKDNHASDVSSANERWPSY